MPIPDQLTPKLSYDHLVLYALYSLRNAGKIPTFENLVAESFRLFPERFHIVGHPNWPDSAQIEKSWLRCRTDKGWISGSRAAGFQITPKGLKILGGLVNILGVPNKKDRRYGKKTKDILELLRGDAKTRSGRIVAHIEKNTGFQKFLKGIGDQITEYEFYSAIFSSIDSARQTKIKNLELVRQYVKDYNRTDILDFLNLGAHKFLATVGNLSKKYVGGMMKRKLR